MPDSTSYPQIPTTVWWGVRSLLNKTPRATIGDDLLGVELSVQPAAARQYVNELKRVGLLNEEGKATELANKWRMSDSYAEAVRELLERCYGEGLLTVAPSPADRAKAIDWFQRQGLGEGAARNKAATYFLIASAEPGESAAKVSTPGAQKPPRAQTVKKPPAVDQSRGTAPAAAQANSDTSQNGLFPINLNLQIHISADASTDQIDAIFSSMRKHLGNARLS